MTRASATSSSRSGGIGFIGLLTLVFVVLKLAEIGAVASWPWLWVLSPIWMAFLFAILIAVIGIFVVVVKAIRQ